MARERLNRENTGYIESNSGYIDGNTVRKLETAPIPKRVQPSKEEYELEKERKNRQRKIQKKREKAKELDLFSVFS